MTRALVLLGLTSSLAVAATYVVDGTAPVSSDTAPGTAARPWKTISRAAAAPELKPGDTVEIRAGTYRETVDLKVSGAPGAPITFTAAPDAVVVIKGSEIIRGPWTRLKGQPEVKEPYPNAFTNVWQTKLDDRFFTDPMFAASYQDKAKRWVSQVIVQDTQPLQQIGPDRIYSNADYAKLATVGRGLDDLSDGSFWFDPAAQKLYLKMGGEPAWFSLEVGVRGFVLRGSRLHDVVVRGLRVRHNRQPGGSWPMVSFGDCERLTVEDCEFSLADFCGLSLWQCRDTVVRRCLLSWNGNTGLGLSLCQNCRVEGCWLLFNNYRRFHSGWHAGGMKCIPDNRGCVVTGCEAAYNIASDGIWFDSGNQASIVGNVAHHNDGCGIFYEINQPGGLIADNLSYANRGRGIYISGSQKTWVVHNTVANNTAGIVAMPRGDDFPLREVYLLNNLLLGNYSSAEGMHRGCDVTLFMGPNENGPRTETSNHSDGNVYSTLAGPPTMRQSWNPDNLLPDWQRRYGEDQHSRLAAVRWARRGTGFELLTTAGLEPAVPLPAAVGWQPTVNRVGCARTSWP